MNGKNDKGKQKFKCKKCNFCFIRKDRKSDKIRGTRFFDNWLKEGYSIRQLSNQYGKNEDLIRENIKNILDNNLIYQIDIVFDNVKYIMIDGTWITRNICLIIYYDYINKKVIRFGFYENERYEYIKKDLIVLRDKFKYQIECFIVDGAKNIKKAIEKVFPNAKIQRCLTHIKRQTQNNISKKPQSNCGKDLKRLINFKNFKNERKFIEKFNIWEEKYKDFLNERTCNGNNSRYTHKKLRLTKSHIKNAIPYMFYYLYDENIKKSNNDLEGLNGVLDGHIFSHRGLRKDRLFSFISIWLYERNL